MLRRPIETTAVDNSSPVKCLISLLPREVPLNRYGLNCQNASFSASWITRGLMAVLLMTPNVGEVKLVSGLANWG